MKALTLMQPWASLVVIGVKIIETRGWRTKYRGPLAIHASAEYPRKYRQLAETPAFRYALRNVRGALPRGAVLGTCELLEIGRTEALVDQLELPLARDRDFLLTQFQFGDFSAGRFAWPLHDIRALPKPVPAKGALGLWEWDAKEVTL